MKACNACGKCCTKYGGGGLSATQAEIDHWEEYQPDIFRYVYKGEIWVDPVSKTVLEQCPFLYSEKGSERKLCRIYQQRPEDCRLYPSTVDEMIADRCEMIEPKDIRSPRQAEKDLAKLMADSRPY